MIGLVAPFFAHAYTGVTIVMNAPTQANIEFVEQFKAELAERKHIHLRVNVITLPVAGKLAVAENSELVIALGVKALEASSKLQHTTPILGVFTPLPVFNSLMQKSRRDLGNFSAIVLDQSYARQMSLIKKILPEAKTLGILLGATSSPYGKLLKEEAEKSGFVILEEIVDQEADLIPKLKKLLESTDALMAIPDPLIYSRETAQPILLTSYRYKKPIFGYSQSYVRAGGLAAVYSNSKQLARQAAEIAIKSQQAPSELPPPQAPKYFSIMLNYQVARSLNIPLQNEETVYKKMLESEAVAGKVK
ncbi:ABC transporter substrate-binding protein [Methylotenera sp.]|uniref:ABC transporter substrate-binding protein n=1 Tax=Methylotenera sp. TaxID=2051956 RepID=UPI00271BD865|nr:ABC transporter substrate binding protein [Methylotenera sp.]MDO9205591.1 ABC transporter substrate binding protein [Methylotenera sp.]MDP1524119.1 ABC transporter substrate binding protein [Methylotenera sp.]